MPRNRYAGEPFEDDDEAVARALEDVSIPALMCSLVHMSGDPSWIRGDIQPNVGMTLDIQGAMSQEDMDEVRRRALPAIAAYRDGGCLPVELSRDLLQEMMGFLGRRPVAGRLAGLFFDDLQFEGGDSGEICWGDEISDSQRATTPVVVMGCGMGGILAGIRLRQAGLPFVIVDKNSGPGGTWWENRYPGARVDVGSHQYCFSFEPAEFWSEYYCQQPELRAYFEMVVDRYDLRPHCRFDTAVTELVWQDESATWRVTTARSRWRRGRGRGALRHQCRGLAESAPAARDSWYGHLCRAVLPFRSLARGPRYRGDPVRASSVRVRAAFRSAPPSPQRSDN